MFLQLRASSLQRFHWYSYVIGCLPDHEPRFPVRVAPTTTALLDVIAGSCCWTGAAWLRPVAAEATSSAPSTSRARDAVSLGRRVIGSSRGVGPGTGPGSARPCPPASP